MVCAQDFIFGFRLMLALQRIDEPTPIVNMTVVQDFTQPKEDDIGPVPDPDISAALAPEFEEGIETVKKTKKKKSKRKEGEEKRKGSVGKRQSQTLGSSKEAASGGASHTLTDLGAEGVQSYHQESVNLGGSSLSGAESGAGATDSTETGSSLAAELLADSGPAALAPVAPADELTWADLPSPLQPDETLVSRDKSGNSESALGCEQARDDVTPGADGDDDNLELNEAELAAKAELDRLTRERVEAE